MSDDRSENGQDWQPVRVVSFERMREIHPSGDVAYQKSAANKIIRVRPSGCVTPHGPCDAQHRYLIHPDDVKIVDWGYGEKYMCENQILAD
jgi:hypothetical protein